MKLIELIAQKADGGRGRRVPAMRASQAAVAWADSSNEFVRPNFVQKFGDFPGLAALGEAQQ
jgi:hypothetical protein